MTDLRTLHQTLTQEAATLAARVQTIEAHLRGTDRDAPTDWTDRAQFLENDEVLEALDDHERARLVQVRQALQRIDAGTYGVCATCGEPINPRRLEALPATTICIGCAQ